MYLESGVAEQCMWANGCTTWFRSDTISRNVSLEGDARFSSGIFLLETELAQMAQTMRGKTLSER